MFANIIKSTEKISTDYLFIIISYAGGVILTVLCQNPNLPNKSADMVESVMHWEM